MSGEFSTRLRKVWRSSRTLTSVPSGSGVSSQSSSWPPYTCCSARLLLLASAACSPSGSSVAGKACPGTGAAQCSSCMKRGVTKQTAWLRSSSK